MQAAAGTRGAPAAPGPATTSPPGKAAAPEPSTLSKLRCFKNRDYFHRTLPHGVKCLMRLGLENEKPLDESWLKIRYDITDVRAKFDGSDPTPFEGKDALHLILPEFRAQATVNIHFTQPDECRWELGWMTACYNYDTYVRLAPVDDTFPFTPAGKVFCNIPARFVSCSDDMCSPWHTVKAFSPIKPRMDSQSVTVVLAAEKEMHLPDVQWEKTVGLRTLKPFNFKINDQYYSWLVLRNATKEVYYSIYTIVWERKFSLSIDVQQPLGNRVKRDYRLITNIDSTEIWPLPEIILEPVYLAASLRWAWYPEDPTSEPLIRKAALGDLARCSCSYAISAAVSSVLLYFTSRYFREH